MSAASVRKRVRAPTYHSQNNSQHRPFTRFSYILALGGPHNYSVHLLAVLLVLKTSPTRDFFLHHRHLSPATDSTAHTATEGFNLHTRAHRILGHRTTFSRRQLFFQDPSLPFP